MEDWPCFLEIQEYFLKLFGFYMITTPAMKELNITDTLIIPMTFIFLPWREQAHDNK